MIKSFFYPFIKTYTNNIIELKKTTIPISKKTRDRLIKYGGKGETWNELINKILNELDKLRRIKNDQFQ